VKAGIQEFELRSDSLDPGFRRGDDFLLWHQYSITLSLLIKKPRFYPTPFSPFSKLDGEGGGGFLPAVNQTDAAGVF
jgi:hypothetical protein